jgi:hypothetical protein
MAALLQHFILGLPTRFSALPFWRLFNYAQIFNGGPRNGSPTQEWRDGRHWLSQHLRWFWFANRSLHNMTQQKYICWKLSHPGTGPSPLRSASSQRSRRRSPRRTSCALLFLNHAPWARLGFPEPSPRPPRRRRAACAWPGWARCDVR